jgi:hypothetical protein
MSKKKFKTMDMTPFMGEMMGWGQKQPVCFHGAVPFLDIGKTEIFIGKLDDIEDRSDWSLVIDCAGGYYSEGEMTIPRGMESLKKHFVPTLNIPWSDYSLPPVRPEFWKELVKILPIGKVAVGCVGGHGRTGTAIAAILIASKKITAEEAIEFVRENYCDRAIETSKQEEYLVSVDNALNK